MIRLKGVSAMKRSQMYRLLLFLGIAVLLCPLLSSCVNWEEVGEGVAKGQGTAQVELSKQETAVARDVATAVESYEEERDRQGQPACTAALLPVVVAGLVLAWRGSRGG
jgi:hypothetical protein